MIKLQDLLLEQQDILYNVDMIKSIHNYARSKGMFIKYKRRFAKQILKIKKWYNHPDNGRKLKYLALETDYSEIISAAAIANAYPGSTDWRTKPVNYTNILSTLKVVNGIQNNYYGKIELTGGDDAFHRCLNYESDHTRGFAIDFVQEGKASDDSQLQMENAIAKYIYENPDVTIIYINEYKKPSDSAKGNHHHISIDPTSTDSCYFHFFKDIDGKTLRGDPGIVKEKIKESFPVYLDSLYPKEKDIHIKDDKPNLWNTILNYTGVDNK